MTEHIKVGRNGAVLAFIFAHLYKKRAPSNAMYRGWAVGRAPPDAGVRAVLFGSEGDAFTAGNDLYRLCRLSRRKHDELAARDFIEAVARGNANCGRGFRPGDRSRHNDALALWPRVRGPNREADRSVRRSGPCAGSRLQHAIVGAYRTCGAFAMFALGEALSDPDACALGLADKVLPKDERPLGASIATKRLMRDRERITWRRDLSGSACRPTRRERR